MEYDKPEPETEVDRVERLNQLQTSMHPMRRRRRWPKIVALFVIALLLAAAAGYYFVLRKQAPAPAPKPQPAASTAVSPPPAPVATKQYQAASLGLSFSYPETWTVVDKNDGQVLVQSPHTSLSVNGQKTTGVITVAFRPKGQALTAFDKGNGTAVLDSVKLSYAAPSQAQRAQTYLSYVQYPADMTVGNLDALYVTGDYGYQKGQAVPKTDLANGDPQISVSFSACADQTCQATAATPVTAADWAATSDAKTVTALIQSIVVM